jgi:D-alanyl-D-alanine carboxypeptidase/D-alanyl-D-alanine-endopeptidase (penicillin-binding protein 4)
MKVRQVSSCARAFGLAAVAVTLVAGRAQAQAGSLAERIDATLAQVGPHAVGAVRVVSLARGEVRYERNADLSLNPASNMKLLTSATALAKLGPEYRFTTRVLASARPQDGRLAGSLILQGGGDPVLETNGLEALADTVKAAGIREVEGGLTVDDYRFDAQRLGTGWSWDDEPYYYSAQISALTLNRNVIRVEVRPGKSAGDPAVVTAPLLAEYATLKVSAMTAASGSESKIDVERIRGRNEVTVTGSIPLDRAEPASVSVTMEEPELYAGAVFRKLLAERGVHVAGAVTRARVPEGAERIAEHASVPLSEIVTLLNKPSDNLIAEMLLKELGYAVKKSGDAGAGSTVVEGWLKESGIDTGGVKVNDGSGLSRMDLVTARVLSDLLVKADAQPWKEPFFASLPIAGVDGTLRGRMKGTVAERNVHAKSGTLAHVTALSGYVTTAGGERLAFSILINNWPGPVSGPMGAKKFEDAIVLALAEQK